MLLEDPPVANQFTRKPLTASSNVAFEQFPRGTQNKVDKQSPAAGQCGTRQELRRGQSGRFRWRQQHQNSNCGKVKGGSAKAKNGSLEQLNLDQAIPQNGSSLGW
jgi:hypothetical protein